MKENILWLITARAGSMSIRNKNIKMLNGIPLIAYKIRTALSISKPEDVWVSTDSEKYANIAREHGAYVPFLRPKKLATSMASSEDVVLHAMKFAESIGKEYKFIGLLEPTSPFVYYTDILKALNKLDDNENAQGIVAVRETRPNTFFIQEDNQFLDTIAKRMDKQKLLGRQNFKKEITPSGGFYISRWNFFLEKKTFYSERTLSYEVPFESELEIDEPIDWAWAEFLVEKNYVDLKKLWK